MTTNIYFIRCGEFVKIGRGGDPRERMRQLQCGNPYALELMGSFEAGPAEEARLQSAFAIYLHRAEWFFLSRPVRAFIEKHCHEEPLISRERWIIDFLTDVLKPAPGERLPMRSIWERYKTRRDAGNAPELTLNDFIDGLELVCRKVPIEVEARGNKMYCLDVRLSA